MVEIWLESCLYANPTWYTLVPWIMVKVCNILWILIKLGTIQVLWITLALFHRVLTVLWVLVMLTSGIFNTVKSKNRDRANTKLHRISAKNLGKVKKSE